MRSLRQATKVYREEGLDEMARLGKKYLYNQLSVRLWPVIHRVRYHRQRIRYHCPARPTKVLYINPAAVRKYTSDLSIYRGMGQIRAGNWDIEAKKISKKWKYKGLIERFQQNKPWEETEYVNYVERKYFERDKALGSYQNVQQFLEERCDYVESIYNDIVENGYKPNRGSHRRHPPDSDRRKMSKTQILEPIICIGRNGELILVDGFHRIAMSKIAEVTEIPVHVLCRHQQWQQIRDKYCSNEVPLSNVKFEYQETHPDL